MPMTHETFHTYSYQEQEHVHVRLDYSV